MIFSLDATMSRQPTWDTASRLQAEMFREAASVGGLDIQLVYYRGLAECRASPFVARRSGLRELMSRIDCRGGQTQIGKVLAHARRENDARKVAVMVFIGDAMEESLDALCAAAGELGLRNVRAFMFQEGYDPVCEQAFREVARLTHGAFCRFSPGSAHELAELLARGGGLCRRRHEGFGRSQARGNHQVVEFRGEADRAAQIGLYSAMPFILGVAVLLLLLWAGNSFSKADPKQVAWLVRKLGGAWR